MDTNRSTIISFICVLYFENESLIATGVDNYIKFIDKETMKKYTNDATMNKYNLKFTESSYIYKEASKDKIVDSGIEKAFR